MKINKSRQYRIFRPRSVTGQDTQPGVMPPHVSGSMQSYSGEQLQGQKVRTLADYTEKLAAKHFKPGQLFYIYESGEEGDWNHFGEGMTPKKAERKPAQATPLRDNVQSTLITQTRPNLDERVAQLEADNRDLKHQVQHYTAKLQEARQEADQARAQLIEKERECNELDAQLTEMTAKEEAIKEFQSELHAKELEHLRKTQELENQMKEMVLTQTAKEEIAKGKAQGMNDMLTNMQPLMPAVVEGVSLIFDVLKKKYGSGEQPQAQPAQPAQQAQQPQMQQAAQTGQAMQDSEEGYY